MSDATQQARNDLRKMFNDQGSGRWLYDSYISIDLAGDFACAIVKLINDREAALREELARNTAYRDGTAEMILGLRQSLTAAEQRNETMSKLLQRCIPVCRYKGSHTERQLINEIEEVCAKPTESGASE